MFPTGIKFETNEKQDLLDDSNIFHFPETRFAFINDHKGLRLGKRHILLGTTGTGKSTLTRSILLDVAKTTPIVLYSTEETLEDTKAMFALRDVDEGTMKNICFVYESEVLKSMRDNNNKNLDEWKRVINVKLLNHGSSIVFFDNITTSAFYDGVGYNQSIEFLETINALAFERNVCFFIVAHTKKGIKDDQQSFIAPDDVKGPTSLTMKAEYLYVYQRLTTSTASGAECSHGIARVVKARTTGDNFLTYALNYNFERKEYIGDGRISSADMAKLYKERVQLGGKKK